MKLAGILNTTAVLVVAFSVNACTELAQSDGSPALAAPPVVTPPVTAQPVKKVKPPFAVVLPGGGGGGWG